MIAWEDRRRGFFDRLTATIGSATFDPVGTFTKLGESEGDIADGVRFSLITSVIGWLVYLVLLPCLGLVPLAFTAFLPERIRALGSGLLCGVIGSLPFAIVLGSLGVELVHGAIFHVVSRLLGGSASFPASVRAMLYTSAIRVWLLPALLLTFIPFVGWLVQPTWRVGFVLWACFACYGAARGVQKVPEDRLIWVALLTPIASALLTLALVGAAVAGFVFVFVGSFSLVDLPWR